MPFDIKSIQKGRKELPARIILLGTHKVGKTTFASEAPEPILIPIKGEEGADDMDIHKFPIVNTYDELLQALGTLAQEDHNFRTVVLDSSSALEPIIWDQVCVETTSPSIERALGGYAKGYIEALKCWRNIMQCLDWLRNNKNMASIIIGHVMVKQFNDPMQDPYDQYQWNIHHKAAAAWMQWADAVLFARFETMVKTVEEKGGKTRKAKGAGVRKLYTQERPAHPGGGRGIYGRLPYEIELNWEAFSKAIKEG